MFRKVAANVLYYRYEEEFSYQCKRDWAGNFGFSEVSGKGFLIYYRLNDPINQNQMLVMQISSD